MKIILSVTGMKCGGCESSVRQAVQACAGVVSAQPNFRENSVEVEYEEGLADLDTIRKAIAAKGFEVA